MIPSRLLPEGLEPFAFIAGGFAACPALAGDMDVWVQVGNGSPEDDQDAVDEGRARLLAHVRKHYQGVAEDDYLHKDVSDQGYPTFTRKVCTIPAQRGLTKPVHLMVTTASIQDVLDSFDISTHQVALTDHGVVTGKEYTAPHLEPKVLTQTPKTAERLEKIVKRYHYKGTTEKLPAHPASCGYPMGNDPCPFQ